MKVSSLPQRIQSLIFDLEARPIFHLQELEECIRNARIKVHDLRPWINTTYPPEHCYGREVLYQSEKLEILAITWLPEHFSTIHDHGDIEWSAVQTFDQVEHAIYSLNEKFLKLERREVIPKNSVLLMGERVIHQMGNPNKYPIVTFHVYGRNMIAESEDGRARIFNQVKQRVEYVGDGVFYDLPEDLIHKFEQGVEPDFLSLIRDQLEFSKHKTKNRVNEKKRFTLPVFKGDNMDFLLKHLQMNLNEKGHVLDKQKWEVTRIELKKIFRFQETWFDKPEQDQFNHYASVYDQVICKPFLDQFIKNYLVTLFKHYHIQPEHKFLSVGCGTGLIEKYLVDHEYILPECMTGMDKSKSMVEMATERIDAKYGDLLKVRDMGSGWDVIFTGLNVLQYVSHVDFPKAIKNIFSSLGPKGVFIGDFITPNHLDWYPNVLVSENNRVVSLRDPELKWIQDHCYMRSEIINVTTDRGHFAVHDEGAHVRYLPPMQYVRSQFAQYFLKVKIFDAYSMQPLLPDAEASPSTRYVIMASKG